MSKRGQAFQEWRELKKKEDSEANLMPNWPCCS